ncbi:CheY-like chemotaxis protein [Thioalkalivibrio sp. ALE21]|uniref:response regulator n=1 Tax=Thioalkalivibrio sp. ALE21 TaxID=1158175 RepID=UPI000D85985D|nr:response regulator [Thioalkalivibrio sp. ALE21]PYG01484.1 CheY-like chemotaxis protein [Thioalkalivibrio sp. ALE21]
MAEAVTSETPGAGAGKGGPRTAVLVVDDSKVIRVALQRILRDTHTVYEAADGEEAWARLQEQNDIGLVLTDLSMPKLDGQDLLMRIRDGADGVPADLPVGIVTGQENDEQSEEDWRSMGANAVLKKPFVPGRVREVVAELLPEHAAPDEETEAELRHLRDEVERLRRELMLRQSSSGDRELHNELERLRQALAESRDDATAAYQRADEYEEKSRSLEQELEEARERLNQASEELEHAHEEQADEAAGAAADESRQQRVTELEGEVIRLEHELVELERERDKAREERDAANKTAERLRRERNQQTERAAAAETAQHELKTQCSDQGSTLGQLRASLEQRERELSEAVHKNKSLRARIRDLELELNGGPKAAPEAEGPASEQGGETAAATGSGKASFDPPSDRLWSRPWFRGVLVAAVLAVIFLGVLIYLRGF